MPKQLAEYLLPTPVPPSPRWPLLIKALRCSKFGGIYNRLLTFALSPNGTPKSQC